MIGYILYETVYFFTRCTYNGIKYLLSSPPTIETEHYLLIDSKQFEERIKHLEYKIEQLSSTHKTDHKIQ